MTFNPAWLEYLATLKVQTFSDAKVRLSYKDSRLVRIEIWPTNSYYFTMWVGEEQPPPTYLPDPEEVPTFSDKQIEEMLDAPAPPTFKRQERTDDE